MSQTTRKTPAMTPEKYKAMSPKQRRAFDAKVEKETKAFNEEMDRQKVESFEKVALGLVELIAQSRYLESEIVHNYLERTSQVTMPRAEADRQLVRSYPKIARKLAKKDPELAKHLS